MPLFHRGWLAFGFAVMMALACMAPARADRQAEIVRLKRQIEKLDLLLLNKLYEGFARQPEGNLAARLPADLRMALFLNWLDDRMTTAVAEGRRKPVEDLRTLAAAFHRRRPESLFYLYLLALLEHHLGRPAAALALLEPVPDRLCDPHAAVPPYRFVSPGGGEAERGSYLRALYTLHRDASRETWKDLGVAGRERKEWRLLWSYTRAARCEPPVQRLHRERALLRRAVAGERAAGLPEPVVRELARAHPVWSAILPDGFFRLFALARWEEIWREAGRSAREEGAPIASQAAWIAAAQRARPGNLPATLFQAGLEEGRGRRRESLNALDAFWARRVRPGDGRPLLAPHEHTPVPLGSLLLLASRHGSLALREEGAGAYVRQLAFYGLRGLEALPVSAAAVPLVYLTLAALCLAQLAIHASPPLQRFEDRLSAVTFAWWNRRQDSRLEVDPAADFPQPDDAWQERPEGGNACELAHLVAALAAADSTLRQELVELLTGPQPLEQLPGRWEEALPPAKPAIDEAGTEVDDMSQRLLRAFVALAPGSPAYWSGLLRDLSFAQFEEAERPIVELVSNAVDATRQRAAATGNEMESVYVYFLGGWRSRPCEATVWDQGCGMSPESLLFNLLVPLTTTKEDSLATIGRFGVGFFSVLRYLMRPDACVRVETADGRHRTELVLTPPHRGSATGSPEVTLRVTPSTRSPFTKVEVQGDIAREDCEKLLARTFRFLPSPPVTISSTQINDPAPYRRLDAGGGVELLWRRLREPGPSSLSVVIRGETVGSPVELFLPEGRRLEVGLCLPATAAVALSRNLPVVDEPLAAAIQRAATAARSLDFSGFTLLNLLSELVGRLRLHHRDPHRRERLDAAIRNAFLELRRDGATFLPLGPEMERIDARGMSMRSEAHQPCVYLHPLLFEQEGAQSLEPFRLVPGEPVYALPFRQIDGAEEPVLSIQCAGLTFLDERHRPRTAAGRAAVDLLGHPRLAEIEVDGGRRP